MDRRKFAGAMALTPLAVAFLPGDKVTIDKKAWEGAGRVTFAMDVLLGDGFVPRRGDSIVFEIPAMTVTGRITTVKTKVAPDCLHCAFVLGEAEVVPHFDFTGRYGPADVKLTVNGVERQGLAQNFRVTEAPA